MAEVLYIAICVIGVCGIIYAPFFLDSIGNIIDQALVSVSSVDDDEEEL